MPDVTLRVELQDIEDVQAVGIAAVRFGLKIRSVDNGNGDEAGSRELAETTSAVVFDGVEIAVGRFVVDWWKRREVTRRGGLVFDLTEHPGGVYRYMEVPYGDVVIITADGETTLQVSGITKDQAERLMGKISGGTDRSALGIQEFGRLAGAKKLVSAQ
ncbi:MAG: hypothetical protein ACT4OM_05410 [Actinomycetota bacterium]